MAGINYKRRATLKYYLYSFISVVAAAGLLWLNSLTHWQFDWTKGARNTLNQASIELVNSLGEPLEIQAYYSNDAQTRQQVRGFINRYQRFKQDISLTFIDTQLPGSEVTKLGFSQLGQLKLIYQDKQFLVTHLNEKAVTDALYKLARKTQAWAAVIQGHGEHDPLDAGNNGLSQLARALQKISINVQPLNLRSQKTIPQNTSVLVIAGARNAYSAGELKLIEQYLENGGNLLWLRDPARANYFTRLEQSLGVASIPGVIIDANTRLRILLGIKHAAVIPVTEFHHHSITGSLKTHTLFPFAGGFRQQERSGWKSQVLFKSLQRSWSEQSEINQDKLVFDQTSGDVLGPLAMGLALSRQQADKLQRAVVIGDSDFIANGYLGYGANFELGMNIFNWLTEDEKLMPITARAAPDQSLQLNESDILFIALVLLVLAPAALIGSGLWLRWLRHRH